MFNPFVKFEEKFIPAFRNVKKRYLVSQTFTRVDNAVNQNKTYLMLTHYDDKGLATIHFNALSTDKFSSIIDLENDIHREKLIAMLTPQSKYIIYSSLTIDPKEVKSLSDKIYKEKVQKFIEKKTNWRISREQTIKLKLEITFGELYVALKYGTQTIRIRLEELETI
jgi:hypothetical protein